MSRSKVAISTACICIVLTACKAFDAGAGAENLSDGGSIIDGGGAGDAAVDGAAASDGAVSQCDASAIFCADFEHGLPPFTTSEISNEAWGTVTTRNNPDAVGRSLFVERNTDAGSGEMGVSHELGVSLSSKLRFEFDVWIDASITNESPYAVFALFVGPSGAGNSSVNVYIKNNSVYLYIAKDTQFATDPAAPPPIPIKSWVTVRLETSLSMLDSTLYMTPRGSGAPSMVGHAAGSTQKAGPIRFAIGVEHFSPQGALPNVPVYFDRVSVTDL